MLLSSFSRSCVVHRALSKHDVMVLYLVGLPVCGRDLQNKTVVLWDPCKDPCLNDRARHWQRKGHGFESQEIFALIKCVAWVHCKLL